MKKILIVPALAVLLFVGACTPSQEQVVTSLITVIANTLPNIVPLLTSNPQAVQAAKVASTDAQLAVTLAKGFKVSDSTSRARLNAVLDDLKLNLAQILPAVRVVNPASQARVTDGVNIVLGLITSIEQITAPAPSAKATVYWYPVPTNKKDLNQVEARIKRDFAPVSGNSLTF